MNRRSFITTAGAIAAACFAPVRGLFAGRTNDREDAMLGFLNDQQYPVGSVEDKQRFSIPAGGMVMFGSDHICCINHSKTAIIVTFEVPTS